eukprot:898263-Rhodomonas_salina.3
MSLIVTPSAFSTEGVGAGTACCSSKASSTRGRLLLCGVHAFWCAWVLMPISLAIGSAACHP